MASATKHPSWLPSGCSSDTLPQVTPQIQKRLEKDGIHFVVREECTSLCMVPSGRHVLAGFTDGTVRLFDVTGQLEPPEKESLFDEDSSSSSEDEEHEVTMHAKTSNSSSSSSGVVVAHIRARGVHTMLKMQVDCSQDGLYCFAGVNKGSMEMVAIYLGEVERHHDNNNDAKSTTTTTSVASLTKEYRHAHAKLKGFGACTVLESSKRYLLFTGRGIKNIHIWSFCPQDSEWLCLYDTQSNGSTIQFVKFRHDTTLGTLQGLSKSDQTKLRVWDLSTSDSSRPKRPSYWDVASTESALGILGNGEFAVCASFDHLRVVSLNKAHHDDSQMLREYDLALPLLNSKKRQARGQLQSVVNVTGMNMDSEHAVLELSNGALVHYSQNRQPPLLMLDSALYEQSPTTAASNRPMSVTRVGSQGIVVSAVASFTSGRGGSIVLHRLDSGCSTSTKAKFWGFHGVALENTSCDVATIANSDQEASRSIQPTPTKTNGGHRLVTPRLARANAPDKKRLDSPAAALPVQQGNTVSPEQQPSTLPVVVVPPNKTDGAMLKFLQKEQQPKKSAPRIQIKMSANKNGRPALSNNKCNQESRKPSSKSVGSTSTTVMPETMKRSPDKKVQDSQKVAPEPVVNEKHVTPKRIKNRETPMESTSSVSKRTHNEKAIKGRKERDTFTSRQQSGAAKASSDKPKTKRKEPEASKRPALDMLAQAASKRTRAHSPKPKQSKATTLNGKAGRPCKSYKSPMRPTTRPTFLSPKPRHRPKSLLASLPKTTVAHRLGWDNQTKQKPSAHQRLLAQFRAEHEHFRNMVLSSADMAMQYLCEDSSSMSVEEARSCLEDDIEGYKEMLQDMLFRQELELSAMSGKEFVPFPPVSFPFPTVFSHAKTSFEAFVNRKS